MVGSDNPPDVSVAELRAGLADILNAAARGRTTYITNRGRRIAKIAPLDDSEATPRRSPGT